MKERRVHKRAKKCFANNITAIDSGEKHITFSHVKSNPKFYDESGVDFSPAGLKLICSKSLPEDVKVQMKMLIPDEETLNLVRANGTIQWFKQVDGKHKKYFMLGIRFDNLKDEDKEKLIRLWEKYKK